jgi:outer membrane protein OmpA-like peptidoglycan-associated protein
MKRALFAATLLALPLAARGQPIEGLYVGAGAGANWQMQTSVRLHTGPAPGPNLSDGFDTGVAALGSIGWGFGNGVRIEAEGSWRRNSVDSTNRAGLTGAEQKAGVMANVVFDMDIGSPWVFPYLGAGAGSQWVQVTQGGNTVTDPAFAYQAIAGASFPIPWVVGLSATLEYRYMGVNGKRKFPAVDGVSAYASGDNNNAMLLGLRYAFDVTPPAPVPAPAPAAAPAPAPARSYLVFFDWDSAALTDRARQIVAEAAQNATRVQVTRIEVAGHADRSGTPQYNLALSRRRAEAVAAELVKQGVAKQAIDIQAFGETKPLVPTGDGVREAQNRRVEIVLR